MRIIIDANLPDISRDLCPKLGITEIRKIKADTPDRVIYDGADRQNFDVILTRDSDFEPFTHEMLKYKAAPKDFTTEKARASEQLRRFSQAPKVIFFKRNAMNREELEAFLSAQIDALKTFVAVKNPQGAFGLQYLTVSEDEFHQAISDSVVQKQKRERRFANPRPYLS